MIVVDYIKNNDKRQKQNIIIIPKKNVKKAHLRNKIRRQIRAILQEKQIKDRVIKYLDSEQKPNFQTLRSTITAQISRK